MAFNLRALPFTKESLVPYISRETMDFHYGKHHNTYVNNLNKFIVNTEFEGKGLVEIITHATGAIFNNAAQVWNHDFYWDCLTGEERDHKLEGELSDALVATFGSKENFKEQFIKEAVSCFGSGWTWLVQDRAGLRILSTSNANNPLTMPNTVPLLVCDVWEHAYYIDYRNARAEYLENFFKLINWTFVTKRFMNEAKQI